MSADNNKKLQEIINRLDHVILQQEDRPEVYTMQRVARHVANIDVSTTSLLDTMKSVFKVNEKQTIQQKSLFQRIGENFQEGSNKLRASIISLTDVIKTTLDFKGHLSRIDRGIQEMKVTAKLGFMRMQEGFTRWFERLIFRVNDMKRIIGLQKTTADDLNSFLTSGRGNNSPLTVGFISALYQKIFAYETVSRTRDRKTELHRYKANMKVQRNQASDLKRIANHLTGRQLGWIVKLFRIVGVGLMMLGGQIVTFSSAMGTAAATATKFGKLGQLAAMALSGFGKLTGGSGKMIKILAEQGFGEVAKTMMKSVARQIFFGLGRVIAVLLNPVALVGLVAGYGIYKIFEEEIDRIFGALKSIFMDPEKRQLLFGLVSQWFSDVIHGIGAWFGLVGDNIKDAVPEGAVEGIVGAFDKVVGFVKSTFNMFVNNLNKIIASFMSIPDSFALLMNAIERMMLSVQEMAAEMIDWIPGIDRPDSLAKDKLTAKRENLDGESAAIKERLNANYETDYIGKMGSAVVDGAKAAGQVVVESAKSIGNTLSKPVDGLAASAEGLDNFLSMELEKKQMAEQAAIEAERQRMITEGVAGAKTVSNAVILEALAVQKAAAEAARNAASVGNNIVNQAVSSVQQKTTNFASPLVSGGGAKHNGTTQRVSQ
ncbi:hypothetical protein VPHD527_0403 [Vibrio phage D527]